MMKRAKLLRLLLQQVVRGVAIFASDTASSHLEPMFRPLVGSGRGDEDESGAPKALAVALSFCRLLGLGCPNQAFEIYVTIFDKTDEQKRLIELLTDWGFMQYGIKKTVTGNELVFIRDFTSSLLPAGRIESGNSSV
jgi:hypothetical protein